MKKIFGNGRYLEGNKNREEKGGRKYLEKRNIFCGGEEQRRRIFSFSVVLPSPAWRRKISGEQKCVACKEEGKGRNIWRSIWSLEEKKNGEGKSGKYLKKEK